MHIQCYISLIPNECLLELSICISAPSLNSTLSIWFVTFFLSNLKLLALEIATNSESNSNLTYHRTFYFINVQIHWIRSINNSIHNNFISTNAGSGPPFAQCTIALFCAHFRTFFWLDLQSYLLQSRLQPFLALGLFCIVFCRLPLVLGTKMKNQEGSNRGSWKATPLPRTSIWPYFRICS